LGILFDVIVSFDASWVDNGIGAYECHGYKGVHHAWGWEIDNVYDMAFDGEPREACIAYLREQNLSRKRMRKQLRQLVKRVELALQDADPTDHFNDDELIEQCPENND
jgi:hypothetical protein